MSDCCGKEAYEHSVTNYYANGVLLPSKFPRLPTDGATKLPRDAAFRWRKNSHLLAIDHSGHLWSRGPYPGNGREERDGPTSLVWKKLSEEQWLDVHVASHNYNSTVYYALKADGSIYCWGGPPRRDGGMGLGYESPVAYDLVYNFTPRAMLSSSIASAYPTSSVLSTALFSIAPQAWSSPVIKKHEQDDPGSGAAFNFTLHYGFTFAYHSLTGSGYTSAPQVVASSPGETIEPVSVSVEMRYAVHAVAVIEQTSPYRGPVSVIFPAGVNGNSAAATCTVDGNGFITSIAVTSGGEYDAIPTARIVGTGGNATVDVTPNGSVYRVTLQRGGRYTNRDVSLVFPPPQLPGGTTATLSTQKGMVVSDVHVASGGSGYTSPTDLGLTLRVGGYDVAKLTLTPSGITSIKRPSYTWPSNRARRRIPAMQRIAGEPGLHLYDGFIPGHVSSPTLSSVNNYTGSPIHTVYGGNTISTRFGVTYELRFAGNTRPPVALVAVNGVIMSPVEILDYTSEPYVVAIVPESVRPLGMRNDYGSPDDYLEPAPPPGVVSSAPTYVAPADAIYSSPFWCGPGVSAEANDWAHGCWAASDTLLGGDILSASPLGEDGHIRTKSNLDVADTNPSPWSGQGVVHVAASQGNAPSGWVGLKTSGGGGQATWHDFHFTQTIPAHEFSVELSPSFEWVEIPEQRYFSAHLYGNESQTESAEVAAVLSADERTATVSLIKSGSGYKAEPGIVVTHAVLTPALIGTGFTSMAGDSRPGLVAVKNGLVYACGTSDGYDFGNAGRLFASTLSPVGRSLAIYDPEGNLPSTFSVTDGTAYSLTTTLIENVAAQTTTNRAAVFGASRTRGQSQYGSKILNSTYGSTTPVNAQYWAEIGTIPQGHLVDLPSVFAYRRQPHELECGSHGGGRYVGGTIIPGNALTLIPWTYLNGGLGIYDTTQFPTQNPKGDYLLPPGYPVFVIDSPDYVAVPQSIPFGLTGALIGPTNAVRVRQNSSQRHGFLVDDANGKTWSLFSTLQGHAALSDSVPYRTITAVTKDTTYRQWEYETTSVRTRNVEYRVPADPSKGRNEGRVCGTATIPAMGVKMNASLVKTVETRSYQTPHWTGVVFYFPPPEFLALSQEMKRNTVASVPGLVGVGITGVRTLPLFKETTPSGVQTVSETVPYVAAFFSESATCAINGKGPFRWDFYELPDPATFPVNVDTCPYLRSCEFGSFEYPGNQSDTHSYTRTVSEGSLGSLFGVRANDAFVGASGTLLMYPIADWYPNTADSTEHFPTNLPSVSLTTPSGQVFQCVPKFLTSPLVGPLNNFNPTGGTGVVASHSGAIAFNAQGKFLSKYGQEIRTTAEANTAKTGHLAGVTKSGSVWVAQQNAGPFTAMTVDLDVTDHGKNYDLIPYYDITPPTGGSIAKVDAVFDGKVIAVAIESEGSGFSSPPVVTFSGGNGSGATAVAVIEGGVGSLAITSPGSGYFLPPSLRFNGTGIPATGRCSVDANGNIVSAAIESPGVYRSPPTVEIIPDKWLTAINVSSGGAEYSTPPTVSICGTGNGRGAAAFAKIDGAVVEVEVVLGGSGYSPDDPPEIVFTSQSGATDATAEAVIDPDTGAILSVTVTSGGSDYQFAPAVLIQTNQGAGAMLKARIAGPVSEVTVTQKGEGYVTAPVVLFQGGGGTGASATAVTEAVGSGGAISATINGKVKYIRVTNEGSMYDFPPEVIVTGGGNAASDQAAAAKSSGEMTREQYESSPAVCVAKAIVEGTVTSFSIVSGGSGYAIDSTAYYKDALRQEALTTKPPVFAVTDGLANVDTIALGAPDIPGGAVFASNDTTSVKFRRKPRVYAPDDVFVEMDRATFSWTSGAAVYGSGTLTVSQTSRLHSGLPAGRSTWSGESDRWSKCCVTIIGGKSIQPALLRRGDSQAILSGARVDLDPAVSFASPPAITLRDAAGSGAVIQSQINGQGILTGATFSSQGTGYTSDCYLEITAATIAFEQCQATAVVNESGSVSHVVISDAGKGYISPVAVVHNGKGSGCVVAVHLETGIGPRRIACIEVLSGGSGYRSSSPPEIYVYDSAPDFLTSDVCKVFNAHLKRNGRLSVNFTSAVAEYINRNSPNAWEIWQTPATTALSTSTSSSFIFTVNGSDTRAVATVRLLGIESIVTKRGAVIRSVFQTTLGGIASAYAGEAIQSVSESPSSGCRPHETAEYAVNGVAWREATTTSEWGGGEGSVLVADRE